MIKVIISTDSRYPVDRASLEHTVLKVLDQHIRGEVEVEVNVVGDRKMRQLNFQYRGLDKSTDVLSFAFEDPNPWDETHRPKHGFIASPDQVLRLGMVVISYPQALLNAAEENVSIEQEINFLAEHGTMHLLGFHHPH